MFNIDKEGKALGFKVNKSDTKETKILKSAIEDEYILSHENIDDNNSITCKLDRKIKYATVVTKNDKKVL
jgi:hypothetical protein